MTILHKIMIYKLHLKAYKICQYHSNQFYLNIISIINLFFPIFNLFKKEYIHMVRSDTTCFL